MIRVSDDGSDECSALFLDSARRASNSGIARRGSTSDRDFDQFGQRVRFEAVVTD